MPLSHCTIVSQHGTCWLGAPSYVDAPDQLAGAAVYIDARLGHAGPSVRVQLLFIAVDGCGSSAHACRLCMGASCVPTYCAAVRSPHHIVVLELEVLVEHGRVQLDLAVELVADLLPVGGWLRHGYRPIMALWAAERHAVGAPGAVRSSPPSVLELALAPSATP